MSERNWPEINCELCGKKIRMVKTAMGWKPFKLNAFEPHFCDEGADAYDHPKKIIPLFNPRKNRFQR